jgi:hypothetical protein
MPARNKPVTAQDPNKKIVWRHCLTNELMQLVAAA